MPFSTLIETGDVAHRLFSPQTAIVDCRFALDDTAHGEQAYQEQHIPGAVYAHLGRDLAGVLTGRNGRHPLPDQAALEETLGRLGIDRTVQVVAYDLDSGMFASRLWWLLRWQGHQAAAVLNGGLAKWLREGRPTEAGVASRSPRIFLGSPHPEMVAGAAVVRAALGRTDWRLLDARAPERFRGEIETLDRVAGHIPGAVNHPFRTNVDESGVFRPAEELQTSLAQALGGVPPDRTIVYCGSGVTACQNLLALEHAGLSGAKLYPGSWSEWSSDSLLPIETEGQAVEGRG